MQLCIEKYTQGEMKFAGVENCEKQQIKNNNTFVPDSTELVGAVQVCAK